MMLSSRKFVARALRLANFPGREALLSLPINSRCLDWVWLGITQILFKTKMIPAILHHYDASELMMGVDVSQI
jgi:hypothetical protein